MLPGRPLPGQARKSLWIETSLLICLFVSATGQARKSLWIETPHRLYSSIQAFGQARKSLWIETAQAKVHIEGYWSGS